MGDVCVGNLFCFCVNGLIGWDEVGQIFVGGTEWSLIVFNGLGVGQGIRWNRLSEPWQRLAISTPSTQRRPSQLIPIATSTACERMVDPADRRRRELMPAQLLPVLSPRGAFRPSPNIMTQSCFR
jgi:hypothetical protein